MRNGKASRNGIEVGGYAAPLQLLSFRDQFHLHTPHD